MPAEPRAPRPLVGRIGFAHRGARDRAPDNSLEAFELALALGAGGLESDVWLTADGVAVLDHDGVTTRAGRRAGRPIGECGRAELPPVVPSLEDLYGACGSQFELSLDMSDPVAFGQVTGAARAAGSLERLWLCHPSLDQLVAWRGRAGGARLVHSTSLPRRGDPAGHAARLRRAGVDAVNLHVRQWQPRLVHAFAGQGVITLAWDAQSRKSLDRALALGLDGVYSDHVESMVAALGASSAPSAQGATAPSAQGEA